MAGSWYSVRCARRAIAPGQSVVDPSAPVTVGGVRTRDLASDVRGRDDLLGPCRQIAELDVAVRQLVADDDREMGLLLGRRFELLPELAAAELGARGDPRPPELGRDPETVYRVVGIGADHHHRRRGRRRALPALLADRQEQAVQAD